jgi:choline monooxygenase
MTTVGPAEAPDAEAFLGSAITASGIATASPTRIPVERYISPAFAELERQRLWPRVWQIACTVDHVAEAGDWYEYRAGPLSVLIVRGDDGLLRAFQNVCRHRGNTLCVGAGAGITELRCVYHRWSWDLQGRLREVPSRRGFGVLRNDDFPLFEAQVDTWGRFVFVNLDREAVSLAEYLEGVPEDSAWAGLDEFRCTFVTLTPVPANWKVVSEGFSETYHIQGIHRDMLGCLDDVNSAQRVWGHHSVSYQPYAVASPRLGRDVGDETVWEAFVLSQGTRMGPEYVPGVAMPEVPEGQTLRDVIAELIRAHQATRGADLSRFDNDRVLMLNQYNLFPNATVLVNADICTVLSSRPGPTPDEAVLVAMHFARAGDAGAPRSRPVEVTVPLDQVDFGYVLNQDFDVLKTMQIGLHQPGLEHIVLSSEECRIINMHQNLSRYLGSQSPG